MQRMGAVKKLLHPTTPREFARSIVLGTAALVIGTWFIALLTQLKLFENPRGQVSEVTQFFAWLMRESWFQWLSFFAAGFGAGVWLDAYIARRTARRWWENVQGFSIRDAACLMADIKRGDFEKSDRANAIANELRGYVNSGQVPTFLEFEFEKPVPDFSDPKARYEPPYDKKNVGFDAVISKKIVEGMARGRNLSLPWPIPPKEENPHRPFPRPSRQTNALGGALNALLAKDKPDEPLPVRLPPERND